MPVLKSGPHVFNDMILPIFEDEPPVGKTPRSYDDMILPTFDDEPPVGETPVPPLTNEQKWEQKWLKRGEISNSKKNSAKEQLCVKLFGIGGINSEVCLELTIRQVDALSWAFDNKVFNPNDLGGSKLIEIAKYFEKIHSVIGCLLDLANNHGVYRSRNEGRLDPEQTFKHVFMIINTLSNPSESSKLLKTMEDARNSISDEMFWKTPPGNGDERGGLIYQAISAVDFLYTFVPETTVFQLSPYQLAANADVRKKMLEIYDCLISIMKQLHPRLGGSIKNKKRKSIKRKSIKNKKRKSTKKK
jgi:hypothetical protein